MRISQGSRPVCSTRPFRSNVTTVVWWPSKPRATADLGAYKLAAATRQTSSTNEEHAYVCVYYSSIALDDPSAVLRIAGVVLPDAPGARRAVRPRQQQEAG